MAMKSDRHKATGRLAGEISKVGSPKDRYQLAECLRTACLVCSRRIFTKYIPHIVLSAAQPQPNDRAEINAFVPSWALRRAALKGATPSPNGGEMQVGSAAEQFEAKGHKESADLQFQRRSSSIMLQRPHSGDKLSKLEA